MPGDYTQEYSLFVFIVVYAGTCKCKNELSALAFGLFSHFVGSALPQHENSFPNWLLLSMQVPFHAAKSDTHKKIIVVRRGRRRMKGV